MKTLGDDGGREEQVEGTERRSCRGGDGGDVGDGGTGGRRTGASDFPDEIQYVRRCILKRHLLMGPPHEYKSSRAGRTDAPCFNP